MINKKTKKYIFKKAQQSNIEIPKNYENILQFYCDLISKYGYSLIFGLYPGLDIDKIGANAGLFKYSSIVATPEWAFQLVCNNESAHIAFLMTLGHELTHKEKDLFPPMYGCGTKFVAWVNEVHADFGGTQKMLNDNRISALEAITYKMKQKSTDIENYSHPSWSRRQHYITNYNFNSELIKKIAQDAQYSNERVINKISSHFEEIVLK